MPQGNDAAAAVVGLAKLVGQLVAKGMIEEAEGRQIATAVGDAAANPGPLVRTINFAINGAIGSGPTS